MKIIIFKIGIISFLLISAVCQSQEFQGKAYYQTKRKVDLKLEGSEMNGSQQEAMQEMLKKQFEKTYILTFNKEESIYKEEEKLDLPAKPTSGGIQIFFAGGGADQKYYKNTRSKTYAQEKDVFGKPFLVKDSLEVFDWVFGDESKVIGKYLCFKATVKREVENLPRSFNHDEDKDKSEESEKTTKTETITAWYTMDIPVSNGPDDFWGLPGLILELQDGDNMQYVCTKIVMNSKDKIEIKEPTKGKVVNNKAYKKIMEKKMKEMSEQFHGGRERKGSKGIHIKIGG